MPRRRSATEGPFDVIPALDVLEGRCVRLAEGDRERITVDGGDPAEAAARFVAAGARLLHLVDLDGAFGATPSTALLTRVVAAAGGAAVQTGGGYRTLANLEAAVTAGAARVIVGTSALREDFLRDAVALCGERLAVAVDARDGLVAVEGWTRASSVRADELARRCAAEGVTRLVVTSTRRDGSLAGPDVALLQDVMDASGLPVVASGGIAGLDDIEACRKLGCEGAIVGSAIWLGRIRLEDALAVAIA